MTYKIDKMEKMIEDHKARNKELQKNITEMNSSMKNKEKILESSAKKTVKKEDAGKEK